jgi:Family of unknown function (DUF6529)
VEDLVETLARGNVTAVKVVLASVVLALAAYQLVLIAVGYEKLRPRFLEPRPASAAHRFSGDAIVVLIVVVAVMCISYFGTEGEDGATLHVIAAISLLAVLALKVVVVRWWHGASRLLPLLGTSVFALITLTWASSAALYLWGD